MIFLDEKMKATDYNIVQHKLRKDWHYTPLSSNGMLNQWKNVGVNITHREESSEDKETGIDR